MSRSYRKNMITGWTTAESEKEDKKIWHKRMRTHERNTLAKIQESTDEDIIFPTENEVSNVWCFDKDGKHYISDDDLVDIANKKINKYSINSDDEKESLKARTIHKYKGK